METKNRWGISSEGAAAFLLRSSLGVLFFTAALDKFMAPIGASGVSQKLIESFKDTYLPSFVTVPFLYALPYIEITLGTVLLLGLFTREALVPCGLLLITLAFGKEVQQDYGTVAQNFNYVLLVAGGLWLASRDNTYSLDHVLGRGKK
jgi:thiosulfate dehydrogenase (quinone) large subunit